jgi:PhnB protein
MSYTPKEGFPRVFPHVFYEDVVAALDWLPKAFGVREVLCWSTPDGTVMFAEMESGGAAIMLGHPGPDYRSPKRAGQTSAYVSVFVDELDSHCERARAAGAEIVEEPADKPWGLREYAALDPEGQRWGFVQHLRDTTPEEWGATVAKR